MFPRSLASAICFLALPLAACGDHQRARSTPDETRVVRVEQSSRTFYPRNAGCTFDDVPGISADMRQMHDAKRISRQCLAPQDQDDADQRVRTFYTTNPGCTIDGVPGSAVGTDQIIRAKAISAQCYVVPADQPR
jgi:hypothetical protein